MIEKVEKAHFEDYLLMFLLLFVSGNPAVRYLEPYQFLLIMLIEIVVWGRKISSVSWRKALRWSLFLLVIFIGQYLTLHKIGVLASANYIFKILVAIFAAGILKEKFSYVYLRVISVLSVIALLLWGINFFGIHIPSLMYFENYTDSLIIYTQQTSGVVFSRDGILRNAGMFWEPGAYAGYIMVAFFLYINRLEYMWSKHRKDVVILLAALITTFSTTGYIILAIVVLLFFNNRVKNRVAFFVVASIALVGIIYAYSALDFMGDKMQEQYENALTMDKYDVNFSRMGALLFDWQYIQMHPIFGNGLLNETRFSQHISFAENLQAFGNGFSGEIAYFGIPFMLVFLYMIFKNPTLQPKMRWPFLVLFILQMQGEYFMNYPLFLVFPFVYFFNEPERSVNANLQTS